MVRRSTLRLELPSFVLLLFFLLLLILDWFLFKSCNEVCMKLSEYFGMKLFFCTQNEGTRVSPFGWNFFFFRNGELLKITLQFHKKLPKYFPKWCNFLANIHIRLVFLSCDEEFLALSNDPRKILKFSKLRKLRRFFWKFWKWIFLKRLPLKFFISFLVDWR